MISFFYSSLYAFFFFFFFNDTATTEIYTLSLHDALPILEGQPHRVHAELAFCRQRIDRELQTLVGVLLRARPSGLVVDQLHWALWERGRSLRFPTPDS